MQESFNTTDLKNHLQKHILPVKYAYTLSAADFHTMYAKSQGYHATVEMENSKYEILNKYLENYTYDYCEVGSDDGEISLSIINHLQKKGLYFKKHIFIDFSNELLKKCKSTMCEKFSNVNNEFIQFDIEQANNNLPLQKDSRKIILFLGNTLGNVESESTVLKNIYNCMNNDDYLLIGLTLRNDKVDELISYNTNSFRESVLEFLRVLGIKTQPQNFSLKYDRTNFKIVCEYEFSLPFVFQEIKFLPGDKIRCFQSRRYSDEHCKEMFRANGFRIIEQTIDTEHRHVLYLLKKTDNNYWEG